MKSADRMFRVVVLGGIALTACGGATTSPGASTDSGTGQDGNQPDGGQQFDGFPSETAQQVDAFPTEGPAMIDSGADSSDAADDAPCFPQETALPRDAGCGGAQEGG